MCTSHRKVCLCYEVSDDGCKQSKLGVAHNMSIQHHQRLHVRHFVYTYRLIIMKNDFFYHSENHIYTSMTNNDHHQLNVTNPL